MGPQSLSPVVGRVVQRPADLLQGEAQLPAEQDLLEAVHLRRAVAPVLVLPVPLRAEQADGVVVAQGTGRQARQAGELFHGIHHLCHLLEIE